MRPTDPSRAASASRSIVRVHRSAEGEPTGRIPADLSRQRAAHRRPRDEPPVEHADARMPQVVEHPPQPRGERSRRRRRRPPRRCRRRRPSSAMRAAKAAGEGSGCRPGPTGAARSVSRSTNTAPGKCAAAKSRRPLPGSVSHQRTSNRGAGPGGAKALQQGPRARSGSWMLLCQAAAAVYGLDGHGQRDHGSSGRENAAPDRGPRHTAPDRVGS